MAGLTDYQGTAGIVTGASSGIGAQLARDLAARGMRVALLARRADRLAALADEIRRGGGEAIAVPCDVAERTSIEGAAAGVLERFGRVDLLVNDAGYGRHVLFKDHDAADIERMMRTNYLGVVWATKAVLPAMRARRRGWIVNISSVAGKLGQPDEARGRGLARRARGLVRLPELARHRGDVDDPAAAPGAHRGQHRLGRPHHAQVVGAHHALDVGRVVILEEDVAPVARVVDEQIDAAEALEDLRHRALDARPLGDVAG